MRIVAYTNLYLPDCNAGAQTMLRDMLRPLRAAGHQVEVLIHRPSRTFVPYIWEDIPVIPNNGDRRQALSIIPQADVVITMLEATDRAAAIGAMYDVPVVQVIHNERWGTADRLRMRCDLAVYNSEWVKAALGDTSSPSIVVHPPVDPEDYRTEVGEKVTLVNLWGDKGARIFYHCAQALPNVKFLGVIGGYGPQVIEDHPNVTIMQPTVDMREVYSQTRLLLMPSLYESWGRCAIEAAASGIPTIAHPTPGLQEALGAAGTYVDRDDPDAWVGAVQRLLGRRRWLAAHLAALKRADELDILRRFQLDAWTDALNLIAHHKQIA